MIDYGALGGDWVPREGRESKDLTGITPEMAARDTIGESASGPEERGREGGVGGGVGGEEPNRQKGAGEVVSLYVRLAKFASDFAPPGGKPIDSFPLIESNFDLADHVAPLGEALYLAASHVLFTPAVGARGSQEWLARQFHIIDASERISAIFAALSSDAHEYLNEYLTSGVDTENRQKALMLALFISSEAIPLARLFAAGSDVYWANVERAIRAARADEQMVYTVLSLFAQKMAEKYSKAFGLCA